METAAADEPLFAGEIHGVRQWELVGGGRRPRLRAVTMRTVWQPGRPQKARCDGGHNFHDGPSTPHPDCSCGIYANHPFHRDAYERAEDSLAGSVRAVCGVIEAWGRVEVHRNGFRAEWARPVTFFAAPSQLARLKVIAAEYGASAELIRSRTALAERLEQLGGLNRHTVHELVREAQRVVLVPTRGDRTWEPGFAIHDEDGKRAEEHAGCFITLRARNAAERAILSRPEFNLTRTVTLHAYRGEEGRVLEVHDGGGTLKAGQIYGRISIPYFMVRRGTVARAVVVGQRRNRRGERVAIRVFASRRPRIEVQIGRSKRRVTLSASDPIF